MRIAVFSDIHANREALAACLDHAAAAGVDRYVFLGDYVGYGADPGWVVDTLMAHVSAGAMAVLGNHDAAIEVGTGGMNEIAAIALDWTRAQLSGAQRRFLRSLPLSLSDGDQFYVHANVEAPASWDYVSDVYTAARSLIAMREPGAFCGHIHVPAFYYMSPAGKIAGCKPIAGAELPLRQHRRWLAVLGAVGQPRDSNPAACYAVLDDARHVLTYVRVSYDVEGAARKIRAAGLPAALSSRLYAGY